MPQINAIDENRILIPGQGGLDLILEHSRSRSLKWIFFQEVESLGDTQVAVYERMLTILGNSRERVNSFVNAYSDLSLFVTEQLSRIDPSSQFNLIAPMLKIEGGPNNSIYAELIIQGFETVSGGNRREQEVPVKVTYVMQAGGFSVESVYSEDIRIIDALMRINLPLAPKMVTYNGAALYLLKSKDAGVNRSEYDGFYVMESDRRKEFFIKKPTKKYELFTELFAGLFLESLKQRGYILNKYDDSLICARSIRLPNGEYGLIQPKAPIVELWRILGLENSKVTDRSPVWEAVYGRERLAAKVNEWQGECYGLPICIFYSMLLGDYSFHTGNMVVIEKRRSDINVSEVDELTAEKQDQPIIKQFSRIDWGAAGRNFGHEGNQDVMRPYEYQSFLGKYYPKLWYKNYIELFTGVPGLFDQVVEKGRLLRERLTSSEQLKEIIKGVLDQIPVDMYTPAEKSTIAQNEIYIDSFATAFLDDKSSNEGLAERMADIMFQRLDAICGLNLQEIKKREIKGHALYDSSQLQLEAGQVSAAASAVDASAASSGTGATAAATATTDAATATAGTGAAVTATATATTDTTNTNATTNAAVAGPNTATVVAPEADAVAAPNTATVVAPEADAVAAPNTATVVAPEADAVAAPNAATVVAPEADAVAAPNAATVVAPEADAVAAPNTATVVAPESGVVAAPNTATVVAPEADAVAAPNTATVVAPEADAVAAPNTAAVVAPEADAVAAPNTAAVVAPEADAVAAPNTAAVVAPEAGVVAAPNTATVVAPEADAVAAPNTAAVVAPEADAVAAPNNATVVAPEADAVAASNTDAVAAPNTAAVVAPEADAVAAPNTATVVAPEAGVVAAPDVVTDVSQPKSLSRKELITLFNERVQLILQEKKAELNDKENHTKKELKKIQRQVTAINDFVKNGLTKELKSLISTKNDSMTLNDVKAILLLYQFQLEKKFEADQVEDKDEKLRYKTAINRFYNNSLTILMSDTTEYQKTSAMHNEAIRQFKHRHQVKRILADAAMLISSLFLGAGIFMGVYRLTQGKSFFFTDNSTVKKFDEEVKKVLPRVLTVRT